MAALSFMLYAYLGFAVEAVPSLVRNLLIIMMPPVPVGLKPDMATANLASRLVAIGPVFAAPPVTLSRILSIIGLAILLPPPPGPGLLAALAMIVAPIVLALGSLRMLIAMPTSGVRLRGRRLRPRM